MTADRLKELLDYDSNKRVFIWRKGRYAGTTAGTITRGKYVVTLDRELYAASDLAELYTTGVLPKHPPQRTPWRDW